MGDDQHSVAGGRKNAHSGHDRPIDCRLRRPPDPRQYRSQKYEAGDLASRRASFGGNPRQRACGWPARRANCRQRPRPREERSAETPPLPGASRSPRREIPARLRSSVPRSLSRRAQVPQEEPRRPASETRLSQSPTAGARGRRTRSRSSNKRARRSATAAVEDASNARSPAATEIATQ